MQRYRAFDENLAPAPEGEMEIWTAQVANGSLLEVATNAVSPQWVP